MWRCLGGGEHVCAELSSLLTLETWQAEELSPKRAQVGLQPGAVSGVPSPGEAGMSIIAPCLRGSPKHLT